jgi:hypothetical protein
MAINKDWHVSHRMPKNASLEQRIEWHREHVKHCSCRPMPKNLLALLKKKSAREVVTKQG